MSEPGACRPAAVAAGRDHRHVLGLGRIFRRVEMLAHEFEQDADDLVFHPAQPIGATATVAVLQQKLFGLSAAFDQRRLQPLRQRGAQFDVIAAMRLGECFQVGDDGAAVNEFGRRPGGGRRAFCESRSMTREAIGPRG